MFILTFSSFKSETTKISVDVDIKVDANDSMQQVQQCAQALQDDLEQSPLIDEANLYLALDRSAASKERAAEEAAEARKEERRRQGQEQSSSNAPFVAP
jgi:hypothetical protein